MERSMRLRLSQQGTAHHRLGSAQWRHHCACEAMNRCLPLSAAPLQRQGLRAQRDLCAR